MLISPDHTTVLTLAMTPFVEVLGSAPAGLALKLSVAETVIWSLIGNNLLIFGLLLFLKPLERFKWFQSATGKIPQRASTLINRFGPPSVGVLGPLVGMFLVVPAARGFGMKTSSIAFSAVIGSSFFALLYTILLHGFR
jgi:uncharacterized membrane protein